MHTTPAGLSEKMYKEGLKTRLTAMIASAAANRRSRDARNELLQKIAIEARKKRPNLGELFLELDSVRTERSEHERTPGFEPEPIATAVELDSEMMKTEEKEESRDGATVVSGTTYLTTLATGSTTLVPGASGFVQPLSPSFFGGSRLTAFTNLFDLWRARKLVFEYVPLCPTTTPGAIVGYCEPDVMGDTQVVSPVGAGTVRDALARPGAEANSVFARMAYGISFPQQAWYYTSNNDSPNLSIAGNFNLLAASTLPAATSYGLILCHYEIEFMQATQAQVASSISNYYPASMNADFSGAALVIDQAFYCPSSAFAVPGLGQGFIGVGTVSNLNDATTPSIWRNLTWGDARKALTVTYGTRLWFRLDVSGGSVIFYPSLGGAIAGANPSASAVNGDCLYNANTLTPATSTLLAFDQLEVFQLPPV